MTTQVPEPAKPARAARRWIALLCAPLLILATLPAVAIAAAPDPGAHDIAAVFPPWWSPARALIAASIAGQVRAGGGSSRILIVHGDAPGLSVRLRDAGALILLDAQGRTGCQPAPALQTGTRT